MSKLTKDDFHSLLDESPLRKLRQEDVADMFEVHVLRNYTRNEEVFRSQTGGKRFYIVANGDFHLQLGNGTNKTIGRGQMIGEIAALTNLDRLGTFVCTSENGQLIEFSKPDLIAVGLIPASDAPTLVSVLFANTVNYLHELLDNNTERILERGEGEHVEFKEGSNNPNLLKPIAAFLNSKGGTILIGVNDEAEVVGIDDYSSAGADKFDQDFRNLLREKMGSDALPYIRFTHGVFKEKGIYRIDCAPSDAPVFLQTGRGASGESFFIRSGATNQQLGFRTALHYIARRFPNELFNAHDSEG
jgi:hypothetical protein